MPECKKCGHVGSTANYRKSTKGGYLCLDKTACSRRELAKRNALKAQGPNS